MQLPNRSRKNHPLRTERLQRHWSQRELAERVGATIATVKRWELQATVPSPYFRLKLMALFGKSEEELGLGNANVLPITSPEKNADEEVQVSSFLTDRPALWTVPYRRNPYFTGRDDLLHLLVLFDALFQEMLPHLALQIPCTIYSKRYQKFQGLSLFVFYSTYWFQKIERPVA